MSTGPEMRYYTVWGIELSIDIHPPPCIYCNTLVDHPSMDGPLVCPECDMGINKDGSRITNEQWQSRRENVKRYLEKWKLKDPEPVNLDIPTAKFFYKKE